MGPWFKIGKQSPSILLSVDMWWFAHIRLGERGHGNHFSKPFGIGTQPQYQTWITHYPTFHQTSSTDWFARFAAMLELELYCCFFSRFVVHQILLQCVLFFFPGLPCIRLHQIVLQCTKSCFNACFFFRGFVVHQIVLYGLNNVESPCSCYYFIHALNMEKKCGKTKNWRFCIVFLFGAWARIWPEPGQPPKPRRILNTEY